MTILAEPGLIVITNPLGQTVINTGDRLLHGTSDGLPIAGSVFIPTHQGGDSDGIGPGRVDSTTVYDLGAATPGHTQIIGVCKFNLANSAAALAFDRFHLVMGGSIVWNMDGEGGFQDVVGDNFVPPVQWTDYHFRILNGRVELVRRAFMDDTPGLYSVLSHTITYKLRSGNWN